MQTTSIAISPSFMIPERVWKQGIVRLQRLVIMAATGGRMALEDLSGTQKGVILFQGRVQNPC
jgi:hypothetical protein